MKKKSLFSKTKLPDILNTFKHAYGEEKGGALFVCSEKSLSAVYKNINDRGSVFVKAHLKEAILPVYACYTSMLGAGIPQEEALSLIKEQLVESSRGFVRFCGWFGNKKHAYGVVRAMLKLTMKFMFPKQGWTINMLEDSKRCLKLDITRCLYLDELTRLGVPELCDLFCYIDIINFTPLSPAVVFERENTLAEGRDKCDFCFSKGI